MNRKLDRVWRIFRDLPLLGKVGIFLWLIGYPITLAALVLISLGHHLMGAIVFFIPWIEGNMGVALAGKEIVSAIKREFSCRDKKK